MDKNVLLVKEAGEPCVGTCCPLHWEASPGCPSGWWLTQLTYYFLCEALPSTGLTLCCPLSIPVEAFAGDLMTAFPKGAGCSEAGLRSLGPCTPAPKVASGTWEGLAGSCWITAECVGPVGCVKVPFQWAELGKSNGKPVNLWIPRLNWDTTMSVC